MKPPGYFLLALLLVVAVALRVPAGRISLPALPWIGGLMIAVGLGLNIVAARQFENEGIAIRPGDPSTVLTTRGLFRMSRNPMYLGMVFVLTGSATALGSAAGLVVAALFIPLINHNFIRHEEALLEAEFGEEYRAYKEEVRRWI